MAPLPTKRCPLPLRLICILKRPSATARNRGHGLLCLVNRGPLKMRQCPVLKSSRKNKVMWAIRRTHRDSLARPIAVRLLRLCHCNLAPRLSPAYALRSLPRTRAISDAHRSPRPHGLARSPSQPPPPPPSTSPAEPSWAIRLWPAHSSWRRTMPCSFFFLLFSLSLSLAKRRTGGGRHGAVAWSTVINDTHCSYRGSVAWLDHWIDWYIDLWVIQILAKIIGVR